MYWGVIYHVEFSSKTLLFCPMNRTYVLCQFVLGFSRKMILRISISSSEKYLSNRNRISFFYFLQQKISPQFCFYCVILILLRTNLRLLKIDCPNKVILEMSFCGIWQNVLMLRWFLEKLMTVFRFCPGSSSLRLQIRCLWPPYWRPKGTIWKPSRRRCQRPVLSSWTRWYSTCCQIYCRCTQRFQRNCWKARPCCSSTSCQSSGPRRLWVRITLSSCQTKLGSLTIDIIYKCIILL